MFAQSYQKRRATNIRMQLIFCFNNFKKYLNETTLHGLRFIGDSNLNIGERLFFLFAFIAAVGTTFHLIKHIYARWESTPVIIAANPDHIYISDLPFPTITLCNMNQLMLSKVANYRQNCFEKAIIDIACFTKAFDTQNALPDNYKNNNLTISEFLVQHAQPCSRLIIDCKLSSVTQTCSDLFRETVSDEGLCCVFNLLFSNFRYRNSHQIIRDYTKTDGSIPVDWSPETGYQKNLPEKYYPRPIGGIGISMGLTLVLNAELDEYYCSSTNGAGFKVSLHSPIEVPHVRDVGVTIGVGSEVRMRIEAHKMSAAPTIRNLKPNSRRCLFGDETDGLKVYKIYTRRNCENECHAHYIYKQCKCIPYNLPKIFPNTTVCGAPNHACVLISQNRWLKTIGGSCRAKCLSPCFDLTFSASTYSTTLSEGNYFLQGDAILRNMSGEYVRRNIAVVHFYFRQFTFHGNIRNVYVGFADFLSNTGGILSLFLGFSFISLAEAFYYAFIRPIFWRKRPISKNNTAEIQMKKVEETNTIEPVAGWLSNELFQPRRKYIWRKSTLDSLFITLKKPSFQKRFRFNSNKKMLSIRKSPMVKKISTVD